MRRGAGRGGAGAVARGAAIAGAIALAACAPARPTPPPVARAAPTVAELAPPAPAPHVRRPGPLGGAFLVVEGAPADPRDGRARLRAELEELDEIGVGAVVVAETRKRTGHGCRGGSFAWAPGFPDRLGVLLEEAARLRMEVFVGLVANGPACTAFHDAEVAATTRAETERVLAAFGPWLGDPRLAGFYLPDEPGLGWESHYPHYAGLVQAVRASSGKPILVSPFLARSTERWDPPAVGALAEAFRRATGVDVEIWQDSVGVDGVDVGWGRPGARGRLADYLRAISVAIGRDRLWADVELFNCCGPALSPAATTRVAAQLAAAGDDVVARRVAWLPQRQMGRVDPQRRPEAARLRAGFAARAGLFGAWVAPAGYTWGTAPSARYPDRGGELFDGRTGDPRRHQQGDWVGVLGTAEVRIELARGARVDWVGVHVLRSAHAGIELPERLVVRCVGTEQRWTVHPPADARASDGEYVLANLAPLGARCDAIEIELANPVKWTFLSEIELTADAAR